MAAAKPGVIAASANSARRLAADRKFLLAVMRNPPASCDADPVGLTCLIVDDSREFLDAARVLLGREGVEVLDVATNSAEARQALQRLAPDVVLVDVVLGKESGFDLARELDAGGSTVVLISTHAESDIQDLIADSKAVGFLPKSELSAAAISRIVDHRSPLSG
jgi:DNA-binding NarL/FixJ family response regulator